MSRLLTNIRGARIALKWQDYGFNEGPQGPEIYWNIFSPSYGLIFFFFKPSSKLLSWNCLHQRTRDYIQPLLGDKTLPADTKPKVLEPQINDEVK